ncbi:FAD-dependent oxidoreductase [Sphingobacterium sp.]|uniref:FAD-dependent oxidoreductase n=1 Tax=Sphingobacterium sp. TaxID=341027 RepID=UPI00289C5D49|nr:FAD-dependent oxidoreductase [Sphingobacterium sp.]
MIIRNDKRIAIIGAGVAGLHMTKLLLAKDYDVYLYEASNTIGGRIKGYQFDHISIDLGGQWLHQFNDTPNSLTKIIEKTGIPYRPISNYNNHQHNNEETTADAKQVESFIQYLRNTSLKFDERLSQSIQNFSTDPALKVYFDAALVDMASSSEDFSTKEFLHLLPALEPTDYELENVSMSNLIIDYFSDIPSHRIYLSTPIEVIRYNEECVTLITGDREQLNFSHVIVAAPISQLKTKV